MQVTLDHVWRRRGDDEVLSFAQVRQAVEEANAPATDFWTEADGERRSFVSVIKELHRCMRCRFPVVDHLGLSPPDLECLAKVIQVQEHRILRPRRIPISAVTFL